MQRLTPCKSFTIVKKKVEKFKSSLILKIDDYICHLDLRENQKVKKLSFGFDDFIVSRKQILKKNSLENYLYSKKLNLKINIPNPLNKFTNDYINNLKKKTTFLKKKFIYKNFKLTLNAYFLNP